MGTSHLSDSRVVVGIILVIIAVLMFLFAETTYSSAGAIGLAALGLISIAISRRK